MISELDKRKAILAALIGCLIFWAAVVQASELGYLAGTVFDMEGNPVVGAEVYVYDSDDVKRPGDFISNKTGPDGAYTLVLPEGHYWVVARQRVKQVQTGPLGAQDKHSGEPRQVDIEIDVKTAMDFTVVNLREASQQQSKRREDYHRISGHIFDEHGNPVPAAYAMASSQLKTAVQVPEYLSLWTEADGSYVLYLPAGQFNLGAAPEFPPLKNCALTNTLMVSSDMTDIDVALSCPLVEQEKKH